MKYTARIGLLIWIGYLIGTLVTLIGQPRPERTSDVFTSWDCLEAGGVVFMIMLISGLAVWEYYHERDKQ